MTGEPKFTESIFIDTNILVYAFDRSAGRKQSLASKIVASCWENENGCISIQVLQEFYITVTRKLAHPLPFGDARQIIADLSHWHLHSPSGEDILQAIDFQQKVSLSFWDAMIIQSAVCLGCRTLISEDLNSGQTIGDLIIKNPFED